MPALTPEEFLDYLKRSELLEAREFDASLAAIKQETPGAFHDAEQLASEFVKRELLTTWHIRQLMKRKYKGFYLRQYRILGHLGSGGMSSVYLAEHTVMKRRVAIKVLPKRRINQTYLDRFAREARAIAALDSEHVVRAYDVDRFEDVHYIVMEYFEGQNLRQLVEKEGPLAYEDAASYIRQAALGLADAHKIGIVHRDVKPENIVVDEHDFIKILDLGLALLDERTFITDDSIVDEDKILGTADYLAPEQALDSHHVDARADVYGLGATLYFCLTGKPPFPFGTISERLLAHQRKEPASIFNERPDAPVDLVEICAKMMAKKPENRIQSAEHVSEIMKTWLIRNGFAQASDFAFDTNSTVGAGEFESLISQSNAEQQFLLNSESATEIGFGRTTEGFRLSDDELANVVHNRTENSIDLHDPTESGGSISRINHSSETGRRSHASSADNMILSQKAELDVALDPFELALNEIADTTKITLKPEESDANVLSPNSPGASTNVLTQDAAKISSSNRLTKTVEQTTSQGSASVSTHGGVNSSPPTVPAQPEQSPGTLSNASTSSEPQAGSLQNLFGDWYKEVPIWFWTVAFGGYALALFLAGALFTLLIHLK